MNNAIQNELTIEAILEILKNDNLDITTRLFFKKHLLNLMLDK